MKNFLLFAVLLIIGKAAFAQNLQVHYDFGEDRKMITTTLEMFKPDKSGSTFFFVDMDYGSDASGIDGIDLAYWEIARSFKWNENQKFEPRIEYNGGFLRNKFGAFSINSTYLVGGQYTWNNDDFSRVFTLQANYKYIKDIEDASFQITGVWGMYFFNRKLYFSGFADFWKEEHTVFGDNGSATTADFVFLTEPQLWYNVYPNFSFGTEIEISYNFGVNEGTMVNPTLAAKWTF